VQASSSTKINVCRHPESLFLSPELHFGQIRPMDATAKWLIKTAGDEVRATIEALPADLARHAAAVTVIFEPEPGPALIEDGWEADLLGMFSGNAVGTPVDVHSPSPPQIRVFYENLWNMTQGAEADYRDEVRITYLHELGHYLGLDEDDLDERGLL